MWCCFRKYGNCGRICEFNSAAAYIDIAQAATLLVANCVYGRSARFAESRLKPCCQASVSNYRLRQTEDGQDLASYAKSQLLSLTTTSTVAGFSAIFNGATYAVITKSEADFIDENSRVRLQSSAVYITLYDTGARVAMQVSSQALVATLALVLSLSVALSQFRDRRQSKFNLEKAYVDSLLAWHRDVVATLCDLRDRSIVAETRTERRRLLSALIEQGRFMFPNIDRADGYGAKKPLAYRGCRHLTLDFLVAAFNLSENIEMPAFDKSMEALQRHLTSMVFAVVNPTDRLDRLHLMTDRLSIIKEPYEQFLLHDDAELHRHIWR